MKIIYLLKTFSGGDTLAFHSIWEVSIETDQRRVIVGVGSWDSLLGARNRIRPNIITKVAINYETWEPSFYENLPELVFSTAGWQGAVVVPEDQVTNSPSLHSPSEWESIHKLWVDMDTGVVPKIEPFYSEYKNQ